MAASHPPVYPTRGPNIPFSVSDLSQHQYSAILFVLRCKPKVKSLTDWFCLMLEKAGNTAAERRRIYFFMTDLDGNIDFKKGKEVFMSCPVAGLDRSTSNLSPLDLGTVSTAPYALINSMQQTNLIFSQIRKAAQIYTAYECPYLFSKMMIEDLIGSLRNVGVFTNGKIVWNGCEHPDIDLSEKWVERITSSLVID
ncbi:MAG: hypothetical protein M1829_000342 [Trizodia sp. TS-e1964]|nr:MAG: hypothetical protein M1829_000342 [Trizodia sp. TS-e1964]